MCEVAQSCPTLCDPMDCSPPGSSVHGIFQARVLEWGAIAFSRGSSWPRDQTRVSRIVGRCFYHLSHQGSLATNSSILAWTNPRTEELGRVHCMGSQRVGHDWVANTVTKLENWLWVWKKSDTFAIRVLWVKIYHGSFFQYITSNYIDNFQYLELLMCSSCQWFLGEKKK